MGEGDPELSLALMEKYFSCSLENKDIKNFYIFYNRGVCAAFASEKTRKLIEQLQQAGAELYFCGTCMEFYDLGSQIKVGKICCMNDIRITLNKSRTDFL